MWNNNPSKGKAWAALAAHQKALAGMHMRDLFKDDPDRFKKFHVVMDGLLFDYSKHLITADTINLLEGILNASDFDSWRQRLFSGYPVNSSENRPALHMALRGSCAKSLTVDGEDVPAFVEQTQQRMREIVSRIHGQRRFKNIVNIGIGGSDLGPRLVCAALKDFAVPGFNMHFAANADPADLADILNECEPETTLFIVTSKTFGTQETLLNARAAKIWLGDRVAAEHMLAVTANEPAALDFGIKAEWILPLRPWIGGRFSLWSAAGISIALACGYEAFEDLLSGARAMDSHFQSAAPGHNIPVLMALLAVWYRNFWDSRAHAVLPYVQRLKNLPDYLQQIDMESCGKSVTRDHAPCPAATGPVLMGQIGTNAQHAFMQFFHQGEDLVPCDFILAARPGGENRQTATDIVLANGLAQAQALMQGSLDKDTKPFAKFSGNRPSSTLIIDSIDPHHLGMLLAAYEHKIFTQSVLWEINAFDQWGVELGKTLTKHTLSALQTGIIDERCDSSTSGLIGYLRTRSS